VKVIEPLSHDRAAYAFAFTGWREQMSEIKNGTERQGSTGFRIAMKILGRIHGGMYRASGGKLGRTFFGSPVLLLTTTGRRTGRSRTWPLVYLLEGNLIIVVASNGGQPNHPAWYLNLRTNPHVSVQLGDQRHAMIAQTVEGDQRGRLWSRVVREYPVYGDYQRKTDREIPVVILHPTASALGEDKANQGRAG
jgi:F420H(2)-dependent quinone reductase